MCMPLWTAYQPGPGLFTNSTPPTIAQGLVFVGISGGDEWFFGGTLVAFDAAGVQGCSGTPRRCVAIWRAPTDAGDRTPGSGGRQAVREGHVQRRGQREDGVARFRCRCLLHVSATVHAALERAGEQLRTSPAVANGVVYVRPGTAGFAAFDGAGNVGCSGSPKTCTPLVAWNTTPDVSSPVIAGGVVYAIPPHTPSVHAALIQVPSLDI